MKRTMLTLSLLLSLAIAPAPVRAEATPDAEAWLTKAIDAVYGTPTKFHAVGEINMGSLFEAMKEMGEAPAGMEQIPADMHISFDVDSIIDGMRHVRTITETTMTGLPGMPEGQGFTTTSLQVLDGETGWTEMDNPMAGGKTIMRMDLDAVEKLGGALAQKMGMSGNAMGDPISQLKMAAEFMDMSVESVADGEVVLFGRLDFDALMGIFGGQIPEGEDAEMAKKIFDAIGGFRIVLEERTAHMKSMTMGGDEPFMELRFTEYRNMSKAEVPADAFSYTPAEGVEVVDMTAMMSSLGEMAEDEGDDEAAEE